MHRCMTTQMSHLVGKVEVAVDVHGRPRQHCGARPEASLHRCQMWLQQRQRSGRHAAHNPLMLLRGRNKGNSDFDFVVMRTGL